MRNKVIFIDDNLGLLKTYQIMIEISFGKAIEMININSLRGALEDVNDNIEAKIIFIDALLDGSFDETCKLIKDIRRKLGYHRTIVALYGDTEFKSPMIEAGCDMGILKGAFGSSHDVKSIINEKFSVT